VGEVKTRPWREIRSRMSLWRRIKTYIRVRWALFCEGVTK